MSTLNILMAQLNTLVGDFDGNTKRVIDIIRTARGERQNSVVVFPELTLSGYPPEDLLLRPSIELRVRQSLEQICASMVPGADDTGAENGFDVHAVIGYPLLENGELYNVAGVFYRGEIIAEVRNVVYSGESTTYHLRLVTGEDFKARVPNGPDGGAVAVEPGGNATLYIPRGAVRVLRD